MSDTHYPHSNKNSSDPCVVRHTDNVCVCEYTGIRIFSCVVVCAHSFPSLQILEQIHQSFLHEVARVDGVVLEAGRGGRDEGREERERMRVGEGGGG